MGAAAGLAAEHGDGPLFESKDAGGRLAHRLFAGSVFLGVCLIWIYRATHTPAEGAARWAWLGLFAADVWFGFYWVLTQSLRWKPVYHRTLPDRLSQRYEKELPGVDVFVCTADPTIEPPALVVSTVLSVMAYDYPAEKLSVYLSDDAGSELTFYALLEASRFARVWIPFCHKLDLEPRSPAAYFAGASTPPDGALADEWWEVQKLYKEMEDKINIATKLGRIPEEVRKEHMGFSAWNAEATSRSHPSIVQILINWRDPNELDIKGNALPTLVYMAREKRPHRHHNFKAGAMNALIRVSSEISNGPIILNVDCDMYSNNSKSITDALCFFMDERKGHEIGFVQFPQTFHNITKNDIYSNSLRLYNEGELYGFNGFGGMMYIGSGCFHRRWYLLGNNYSDKHKENWKKTANKNVKDSICILEEKAEVLATCTYEDNSLWGKEVGFKYGTAVEDVFTGLLMHCSGWKSVYFNPTREAFLGLAPMTLAQTLVQHKRWSEGHFQIVMSKYCAFIYGHRKISIGLQMAYNIYNLWAANSLPTLCYVIIPSIYLLKNIPLFPKVSSIWFIPFAYVATAAYAYSIWEALRCGLTLKAWVHEQRIWLFKRTASYLLGFTDCILGKLGFNKASFAITEKVAAEEMAKRYEQEIMEFGSSSIMFNILATIALLNLLCLFSGINRLMHEGMGLFQTFSLQFLIPGLVVFLNIPLYRGLFFRKDSGRMPTTVTVSSVVVATLVYFVASL